MWCPKVLLFLVFLSLLNQQASAKNKADIPIINWDLINQEKAQADQEFQRRMQTDPEFRLAAQRLHERVMRQVNWRDQQEIIRQKAMKNSEFFNTGGTEHGLLMKHYRDHGIEMPLVEDPFAGVEDTSNPSCPGHTNSREIPKSDIKSIPIPDELLGLYSSHLDFPSLEACRNVETPFEKLINPKSSKPFKTYDGLVEMFGKKCYLPHLNPQESVYDEKYNRLRNRTFTWLQGRNHCRKHCMDLISINDEANAEIANFTLKHFGISHFWTSGRRCVIEHKCSLQKYRLKPLLTNGWVWTETSEKLSNTLKRYPDMLNWSKRGHLGRPQPDNAEYFTSEGTREEACLAVENGFYSDGIKWHDSACYQKKYIVCQKSDALLKKAELRYNVKIRY